MFKKTINANEKFIHGEKIMPDKKTVEKKVRACFDVIKYPTVGCVMTQVIELVQQQRNQEREEIMNYLKEVMSDLYGQHVNALEADAEGIPNAGMTVESTTIQASCIKRICEYIVSREDKP